MKGSREEFEFIVIRAVDKLEPEAIGRKVIALIQENFGYDISDERVLHHLRRLSENERQPLSCDGDIPPGCTKVKTILRVSRFQVRPQGLDAIKLFRRLTEERFKKLMAF